VRADLRLAAPETPERPQRSGGPGAPHQVAAKAGPAAPSHLFSRGLGLAWQLTGDIGRQWTQGAAAAC